MLHTIEGRKRNFVSLDAVATVSLDSHLDGISAEVGSHACQVTFNRRRQDGGGKICEI